MYRRCYLLAAATLLFAFLSGAQEEHGHHHQPRHDEHGGAHHDGYRHDFSDAERWSQLFDAPERDGWQKPAEVVALMEVKPGMTVADLGAGTGYFLGPLSAAVGAEGRVLGLDVEDTLVHHMSQRAERQGWANVTARRVPYDDPELAAGSVDRVLTVNTWHHIGDRPRYAAKLLRALKPGGRVYVVDYTLDSPSGPPPEHRLPPEQIIRELEEGGFEAEVVEETLPRQYVVVGLRR